MRADELDPKLKITTDFPEKNIEWYDVRKGGFSIHGLYKPLEGERFRRLPAELTKSLNEITHELAMHTAGGRVRFATDSAFVAVKAVMPETVTMPHMAKTGQSGFDVYVTTETEAEHYINTVKPDYGVTAGCEALVYLPEGKKTVTINMPLYDGVYDILIGLADGAELSEPIPYKYEKPVLYYGSSITQGGCASRPGNSYQGMISRMLDTDYINIGLSGHCWAEPEMCEYLSTIDCSVFVLDYDHNAPNADYLERTHERFFKAYRAARPDTPVVFVSKPDFNVNNAEDVRRREIIRRTYNNALKAGDEKVFFIEGETLFAGALRDSCTVDGAHPNDLGFYRMAEVIGSMVARLLK